MAIGDISDNHIEGFKFHLDHVSSNREEFFKWFAASGDTVEGMFRSGSLDFHSHILLPLIPYLQQDHLDAVLDIGYGGGRIISSAAGLFERCYGVDIHNQTGIVEEELSRRGIGNVELIKNDGKVIPLPDNAISVAYSFIVFQHLQHIEIFKEYMKETYRVLRKDGLAIIYFGRFYKWSLNSRSRIKLIGDAVFERFACPNFLEIEARVNETNLRVGYHFAEKLAKEMGFDVLKREVSHRGLPSGYGKFGGQNGMVLRK